MNQLRYIDEENRVLNPFARDIEPASGDQGWGQTGIMKYVDHDARRIEAVLSSDHIDRYGEIIEAKAYAGFLDQFNQRNAFLEGHDHSKQIGHWEDMRVTKHTFEGWAIFSQDPANVEAEKTWGLHSAKPRAHRETFSVGFIGHKFEMRKVELPGGETSRLRVWTDVEAIEGSSVAVPANPHAAAKALHRFAKAIDKPTTKQDDPAERMLAMVNERLSPEPGSELCLLIQSVVEQTLRSQGKHGQVKTGGDGDAQEILDAVERVLRNRQN